MTWMRDTGRGGVFTVSFYRKGAWMPPLQSFVSSLVVVFHHSIGATDPRLDYLTLFNDGMGLALFETLHKAESGRMHIDGERTSNPMGHKTLRFV